MKTLRLIYSMIVLLLLMTWSLVNIQNLFQDKAFLLVGAMFFLYLLRLMPDMFYLRTVRIGKRLLFSFLFLAYFSSKLFLDFDQLSMVRSYSIGTDGGVLFSFLLGIIVAIAFSDMYFLILRKDRYQFLIICFLNAYLIISLLLTIYIFSAFWENVRTDIFLVHDSGLSYQRIGNMIFIQMILNSQVLIFLLNSKIGLGHLSKTLLVLTHTFNAILFMVISQLIGSNSGFVSVFVLLVVIYIFLFLSQNRNIKFGNIRINFKNLLFGQFRKRTLFITVVTLTSLLGLLLIASSFFQLDRFRISGFGTNSSIISRLEILKHNFWSHFVYNPIFGDFRTEEFTTGTGSYLHSLLSIQTHLGLIGSALFILMLVQIYRDMSHKKILPNSYYTDSEIGLFRLMGFTSTLLIAFATAFFTWLPLWFVIGFLGIGSRENS